MSADGADREVRVVVVMGVAGSGKTTLGQALAHALGWTFQDADDLHPAANIAKMAAGRPLDDADRAPWLAAVGAWIDGQASREDPGVVACSALKRRYREALARPFVRFVFIALDEAAVAERLATRRGHFMPPSLLASQFAALEPPQPDERAMIVDGHASTAAQVAAVLAALRSAPTAAIRTRR